MKAALLTSFGSPETLQLVDVPSPMLREGMVRVEIHRIGLNFADIFARLGVYPGIPNLPFIPGIEFSGIVSERSPDVKGVKRGDRVMGFTRQGAYAEEVCVPVQYLQRMPRAMTFDQGASFMVTYLSAWHGMRTLGQSREGERVLVHAAAGGVGTAALQLGREWKCTMIGTASSQSKLEVARQHGATHVINYVEDDFERTIQDLLGKNQIDVVMDSVGGTVMKKSWRLLAPMGRYILFGFAAATGRRSLHYVRLAKEVLQFPLVNPVSFPTKNVSLMGFNLYFLADKTKYLQDAGAQLLDLFKKKRISPYIGKVFPFEQIVDAHSFLQSRKSVGKVVLSVR
jgi:NADPH:quinone reductase-like Zn-dependent oxidoreductase